MRKFRAFTMLLCLLSVSAPPLQAQSEATSDTSAKEFSAIAARWMAAYNGTDPSALIPFYAPHARYISGHVQGLVASGREAVIANFARGMKSGGHVEALTIVSLHRSCDQAVLLMRYAANNAGDRVSGRTLLVLERRQEEWLIVLHMTVV